MRVRSICRIGLFAVAIATFSVGCMTPAAEMLEENNDALSQVRAENSVSEPTGEVVANDAAAGANEIAPDETAAVIADSPAGPPRPTNGGDPSNESTSSNESDDEPDVTPDLPSGSDVPGDVNGDGVFDGEDVVALLDFYGLVVDDANDGDLSGDGVVNITDLGILLSMIGG